MRLLEDETIRVCSASYYRHEYEMMEEGRRDPTINDPHEGYVYQIQGLDGGPGMQRLASFLGMNVGPQDPLYYGVGCRGNTIIDYVKDFHMFCLADGPLQELVPEFCKPHAHRPGAPVYDACLELLDEQELGNALYGPGTVILNLQQKGFDIPLGWILPRCALRSVKYDKIEVGFDTEAPEPSPFLKRADLAWQREVRFAFDAAEQADVDAIRTEFGFPGASPDSAMIVRVPGLSKMLRRIDVRKYL